MRKIILLPLLLLTAILYSCQEKDIEVFSDKNEIYFDKFYINEFAPGTAQADSTVESFFFYPTDAVDIEASLVVCLSGKLLSDDVSFKLKVIEEETTANADEYTIDDEYIFHANTVKEGSSRITDVIKVRLHRSARLQDLEEGVRLVVELVANDEIGVGQHERRKAKIILTEKTSKPLWWDSEVDKYLLGKYSQKKYKLFLDNVASASTLNADMIKDYPDDARKIALEFKAWLMKQDPKIIDEDGTLMTVSI